MGERIGKSEKRGKTRVMATGTFDLIHPGHITYLKKSKALGDELFVVVARDSTPSEEPVIPEEQRRKVVESIKDVDRALLGKEDNKFRVVKEVEPDVISIGPDQDWDLDSLRENIHSIDPNIEVVQIDKYKDCSLCSTSKIIEKIKRLNR